MRYLLLILFTCSSYAQAQVINPPKYPWHFVNYWWDCKADNEDLLTFSMQIIIQGEITDADNIYIAPISGSLNQSHFYGGIQTNTGGWVSKDSKTIVKVGRGGIFSRWKDKDQNSIDLNYADGNDDTLYEAASYEGTFVSTRKKIPWLNGSYKYEIKKINDSKNDEFSWFAAYIINEQTNLTTEIGRLRFDGNHFRLKSFASFVEQYGPSKTGIPNMSISFNKPYINNKLCNLNSVYVVYPENNYKPYVRYADTVIENERVISKISNIGMTTPKVNQVLKFK
jgi:hypothetical protein